MEKQEEVVVESGRGVIVTVNRQVTTWESVDLPVRAPAAESAKRGAIALAQLNADLDWQEYDGPEDEIVSVTIEPDERVLRSERAA